MAIAEPPPSDAPPPIGGWRMLSASSEPRLLDGRLNELVWYEECRPGTRMREHLPQPSIALIIHLGDRFASVDADGERTPFEAGQGFVAGPSTRPGASVMEGVNRGIEVDLTPLAAHRLLGGLPLHELRDRTVPLSELLDSDGERMLERLVYDADPRTQLERVRSFLARRLANEPVSGGFAWAWGRLAASNGRVPIRSLAQELGWSEKRLVRAFRSHFGLSPKKAARLMRFAHCVSLAQQAPPCWAELALRCGYSDQAHLAKEIRAFSGSTPTELLERFLPSPPEASPAG